MRIAARFDAFAVDSSQSARLRPEATQLWARAVAANPDFQFVIALPARFTHDRVLGQAATAHFHSAIQPLRRAGRLGCVLMSFPWTFKYTEENRAFLISLRRAFAAYPLAAEMRHASWMHDEALGVLIDYHVTFANIDQPEHIRAMPPSKFLTTSTGLVRLHGRAPGPTPYRYSNDQLAEWAVRVDVMRRYAGKLFVIGNTERTAQDLRTLLGGQPQTPAKPAQPSLFTEPAPPVKAVA